MNHSLIRLVLMPSISPSCPGLATAQKLRVVVLTDIENEPDDAMSMVRLLTYANQWDVEGLIATTSVHQRDKTAAWRIREIVDGLWQGQGQPRETRARLSDGRLSAVRDSRGPAGLRHGGRRTGNGLARVRPDHRGGRPRRSAARLGAGVGRPQLPRAGALESPRHPLARRPRPVRRQAARLHDLRPGRHRTVAAKDVPQPVLHRQPGHARRRRLSPRHLERDQRRQLPRPLRRRRLQHRRQPLARPEHPQQGTARRRASAHDVPDGGRHAQLSLSRQQRSRRSGAS